MLPDAAPPIRALTLAMLSLYLLVCSTLSSLLLSSKRSPSALFSIAQSEVWESTSPAEICWLQIGQGKTEEEDNDNAPPPAAAPFAVTATLGLAVCEYVNV